MNCSQCGISKEENDQLPPVNTGINHPKNQWTKDFYRYSESSFICPRCHKENELENIYANTNEMNKYGEVRKERRKILR